MAERPPDEDDDDFELELEEVDPEIVAMQRARAKQKTDEAAAKVDVDDILREQADDEDYYVSWDAVKRIRFTTRHLLIATAILALVLTMFNLLDGCSALFVTMCAALGVGWFFVLRAEQRRLAERERIREALARGARPETLRDETPTDSAPARQGLPIFSYSLKEMFITMTVAAVLMGIIYTFGIDAMAMTLGVVAIAGLAINAAGFDPPRTVVLGWWLLLVLYLLVGFIAAVSSGP